MGSHEAGRWDIGIENNAVHVERISDSDKQLFEDFLAPDEARELAGLLTKYADQLDESGDTDESDGSDGSDESRKSEESEESDGSDESKKSGDSDKSDESGDSDKSDESEDSDKSSD
jgi:hypothetical protein